MTLNQQYTPINTTHVEDINQNISLEEVHFVGLYCIIL